MKIILLSIALIFIAVGALAIRLFFVKDGKFSGGSCQPVPGQEGMSCGCGMPEKNVCERGKE
jgi:hypothetical protein